MGLPGAQAVDALSLAGANDDVGEGGAVLKDEHGLVLAGLALVLADGGYGVLVSNAEHEHHNPEGGSS